MNNNSFLSGELTPALSHTAKLLQSKILRYGAALGIGLVAGLAAAQEVIPDFYREPGIQKNRDYVNQHFAEHIDPFTGALQLHYVDIHLPGDGGFDLDVVRSYNSTSVDPLNPAAYSAVDGSLAGLGWTVHFGRVLKNTTNPANLCSNQDALRVSDNPTIELPDGSRQMLAFTGGTAPMALTPQRWRADCATSSATGGLIVYAPNGLRYEMTQQVNVTLGPKGVFAWYTKKITDRNGNYADINYANSSSPEISSVVTSDGRRIDFKYLDGGTLQRRIDTISAHGVTYAYKYEAVSGVTNAYQLKTVVRPDSTSWKYDYFGNVGSSAGSYLMQRLTYPQGGTLTYGYGYVTFDPNDNPMSRTNVVVSKSASLGGAWNFKYEPGSSTSYDKTTVTTPAGTITYQHIGPNYVSNGSVWMVGLLVSRQEGSEQTETLTWTKQKISSEEFLRPGAFVSKRDLNETNAPVLQKRVITLNGATYSTTYSDFDEYGNARSVVESGANGGSRTTAVTYKHFPDKWIIQQVENETVSGGVSIKRNFDAKGNVTSLTKDGVTTGFAYDSAGNVSTKTLPRLLDHKYSAYKRGIPQTEDQPESITIKRIISNVGNVESETNGEQKTTTYKYDGLNRLTGITWPSGSPLTIDYTATTKTASRGGLVQSTTYDGFGRVKSVSMGGILRTYEHDALGRMTFASNPDNTSIGTSYQYDILGRLTRVTYPGGAFQGTEYGAGSKTVTDERSKSTTYHYRSYGNPQTQHLMRIDAPESAGVVIGRNGKDLVTSLTQDNVTRSYDYDSRGYLTTVNNPEAGVITYGRDDAGNMTSRTVVGVSGSPIYQYDKQNRLSNIDYPDATPSVKRTYTRTNKPFTIESSAAVKTLGYDSNDNLTSETLVVGGLTFKTVYGYNSRDQLSTITYPLSQRVVDYAPNNLGRPTQVSNFASSVSFWPSGQISQISYANGTVSSYGQNARLWPSGFKTSKGSTAFIDSSYGYDNAGNLTSVTDTTDSSYARTLGYDDINRVTSVAGPWGSGSVTYSPGGNIKSQVFGPSSLFYSYSANRLNSVSGARSASYGYDGFGNIATAGSETYTYDNAPNLVCVNCADTANKIVHAYDGANQRVSVTKAGVTTYEVYASNGVLLAEYTPSPSPKLIEYIYVGSKRIAEVRSNISKTTLAASAATPAVNQSLTLTATVTGASPSGTVTFYDGATSLGAVALSSGQASKAVQFSSPGARSITAKYSGDANNDPSASPAVNVTVGQSSAVLTASSGAAHLNQEVTLQVTVTGNNPTGTVAFTDNGASIGSTTLSGGKATVLMKPTSAGTHALVAQYAGDALNMASASASVAVQVDSLNFTSITASAARPFVTKGTPVAFSATVTGASPTGTVTFSDGATVLGSVALTGGTATFTTSFASPGLRTITATYNGDAANATSATSFSLAVTVPISQILPILQLLLVD